MFCNKCGNQIPENSTFCIECGAPQANEPSPNRTIIAEKAKKPIHKKWWFWLIVAVVAVGIIGNIVNPGDGSVQQDPKPITGDVDKTTPSPAPTEPVESQPSNSESTTETPGQRNALRAAINYLGVMPFSYTGLIKQLEFEKYAHEDAVYGADNCAADWNEQAAKKAEAYLEMMAFSRESLITQLEFEGYTNEQAVYGAEANGY